MNSLEIALKNYLKNPRVAVIDLKSQIILQTLEKMEKNDIQVTLTQGQHLTLEVETPHRVF